MPYSSTVAGPVFDENTAIAPAGGGAHRYLQHIDGLRALAILPVVLYHLFPFCCPGGFAGVDVFFVISGYLITRSIVLDLNNERFSIIHFYVRRIKRIFPAYFAIILFVLAVFPFFYSLYLYDSVCDTAIFSAFYSANIYFSSIISYFDLGARQNPLLHLWSLGVEEQFYLAAPACIWLLWTARKNFLLYNLIVLFAVSFLFSLWAIEYGHSQFAFFMLPSRAWELLAGSVISQIPSSAVAKKAYSSSLAWLGLVVVLIPYAFCSDKTAFPGMAAIPSVLGASLIILYGEHGSLRKLLSCSPAVWVGKASYSLYLWHWPIFIMLGSSNSFKQAALGVVCAAFATVLSYRFVELPIRRSRAFGTQEAFVLLIVGSLFIAFGAWTIRGGTSKNGEMPASWRGIPTWVLAEKARSASRSSCRLEDLKAENNGVLIKIGKWNAAPTFVLWGDSHALALLPGVDVAAGEYGKGGYYVNLKHGLTSYPLIGGGPFHPKEDREPVVRWLESRPDLSDVFLVNYWFDHIRSVPDIQDALDICERLRKSGKRVFFFRNVPGANEESLRPLSYGTRIKSSTSAVSVASYESQAGGQNQLINELLKRHLATIVPIDQAFLNGNAYYTATETESYYVDNYHLNQKGAVRAMQFVAPMLWKAETAR